jgi:hypothetical protein
VITGMSSRLIGVRTSYHLLPDAYPSTPPPTRRIGPRRWLRSRGRAAQPRRAAAVCRTAFAAADEGVLRDDVVGTDLDLPSPAQPAPSATGGSQWPGVGPTSRPSRGKSRPVAVSRLLPGPACGPWPESKSGDNYVHLAPLLEELAELDAADPRRSAIRDDWLPVTCRSSATSPIAIRGAENRRTILFRCALRADRRYRSFQACLWRQLPLLRGADDHR